MKKLRTRDISNLEGLAYILLRVEDLSKYSTKYFNGEYAKKSLYTPRKAESNIDILMHNYNCVLEKTLEFDKLPFYKKIVRYWL